MDQRYQNVCQQLIELGYNYTLKPDSVLLVEKLLADLVETTENLRKYMKIAQDSVEERDNLKFGAEPYKCDNAKLIKECNELHLSFLQVKEQNEKQQKELRKQIESLEKEKQESLIALKKLRERVRELELDITTKNDRLQRRLPKPQSTGRVTSSSTSALLKPRDENKCVNFKINSAMALSEQKVASLMKDVNKLKQQQLELVEMNEELKGKLVNREKELQRLRSLLEGGRPVEAINADCCYQDVNAKLLSRQDQMNCLLKEKNGLEERLKEARCKQHEAMKHALQLAERNNHLEKELKDIDQMALAVEEECNTTVKNNCQRVKRLQQKLHDANQELQSAEKEVMAMKRERESLMADVDALRIEKRHMETTLEKALDDKKSLQDKVNKFLIIEQDLNMEIDRLVVASAEQKRTIAEMKGSLMFDNKSPTSSPPRPKSPSLSKKKIPSRNRASSKSQDVDELDYRTMMDYYNGAQMSYTSRPNLDVNHWICDPERCKLILKQMIDEEMDKRYPKQTNSLERIRNERDFYIKEYQELISQFRNVYGTKDKDNDLISKLNEKENLIISLQKDKETLSKEKYNLISRLESVQDFNDNGEHMTLRSNVKRLERERDILRADNEKLDEECCCLKQKLKLSNETLAAEVERYQKCICEKDEEIRRIENQRKDLLQNQGLRSSAISSLEGENGTLKTQLRRLQDELVQLKSAYAQLKMLHEQTDKALADSQTKLLHADKEIEIHQSNRSSFDNSAATLNRQIDVLKKDITVFKENLKEMEREKDGLLMNLDDKTERIVHLEQTMTLRESTIKQLEQQLSECRDKISTTTDDRNTRDFQLKTLKTDISRLQAELENAQKTKDTAIQENRRLQDDLAACTVECRNRGNELDIARRQVDDLKRQLQQYVAEVKRIEDLMSQKEIERSEMLDQFRSLSHEATVLETSNHTLESEATQSRVQLSVALDHASDLEKSLDEQRTLITNYERQITQLTSQVAGMETKLYQCEKQTERSLTELESCRDLCVKLDKQKDDLVRQLQEKEDIRSQADMAYNKLRRESDYLQKTLEKDQSTVENLESLLSENRQQMVEQRVINEELQSEVQRLKSQISEMETNLAIILKVAADTTNQSSYEELVEKLNHPPNCVCCKCVANSPPDRQTTLLQTRDETINRDIHGKNCICCECISRANQTAQYHSEAENSSRFNRTDEKHDANIKPVHKITMHAKDHSQLQKEPLPDTHPTNCGCYKCCQQKTSPRIYIPTEQVSRKDIALKTNNVINVHSKNCDCYLCDQKESPFNELQFRGEQHSNKGLSLSDKIDKIYGELNKKRNNKENLTISVNSSDDESSVGGRQALKCEYPRQRNVSKKVTLCSILKK